MDEACWHTPHEETAPGDYPRVDGFVAVRQITTTAEGLLRAVEQVAEQTTRTRLVAGSVDEGMMTFQTRSALWGFPDYTTVSVADGKVVMHARLCYGQSDLGVNRARVEGWLARLGPLLVPLDGG